MLGLGLAGYQRHALFRLKAMQMEDRAQAMPSLMKRRRLQVKLWVAVRIFGM